MDNALGLCLPDLALAIDPECVDQRHLIKTKEKSNELL